MERNDLRLLLYCLIVVPLTWLIFLGWTFGSSIMVHDGIELALPLLSELFRNHGDWHKFIYSPLLTGGGKMNDVFGVLPVTGLFGWLGLPPATALNLLTLFVQVLVGFLVTRTSCDLAFLFGGQPAEPKMPRAFTLDRGTRIGLVIFSAFTPVLGWKFSAGHHTLVLGTLAFLSGCSLILAAGNGTLTRTLALINLISLTHALTSLGQQSVIYGAVFGMPLMVGLFIAANRTMTRPQLLRGIGLPLLVLTGSLAVSIPRLIGMIHYASSDDASRAYSKGSIIYSYVTATARDWYSSIPWAHQLISSEREPSLFHEINYPLGPFVLLLALIPWRRFRALGAGLTLTLLLPILFSMDFKPVSGIFPTLVPILKSFRVPERAALPFFMILPSFIGAVLIQRWEKLQPALRIKNKTAKAPVDGLELVAVIIAAVTLYLVPVELRELLTWIGTALLVGFSFIKNKVILSRTAVVLLCAAASLSAFRERISPYSPLPGRMASVLALREEILQKEPRLESPFVRAKIAFPLEGLQSNMGLLIGISTLDGYGSVIRRFGELIAALEKRPFNPAVNNLRIPPQSVTFNILRQLYNVCCLVDRDPATDQLRITPLGTSAGPAWFSNQVVQVASMEALAQNFTTAGFSLFSAARGVTWVVGSDPAVSDMDFTGIAPGSCKEALVQSVEPVAGSFNSFRVKVQSAGNCPLTVATNYAHGLSINAISGNVHRELSAYPAYGALIGVLVPAGTQEVLFEARPYSPAWVRVIEIISEIIGFAVLLLTAWLMRKRPVAE